MYYLGLAVFVKFLAAIFLFSVYAAKYRPLSLGAVHVQDTQSSGRFAHQVNGALTRDMPRGELGMRKGKDFSSIALWRGFLARWF